MRDAPNKDFQGDYGLVLLEWVCEVNCYNNKVVSDKSKAPTSKMTK